MTIFACGKQLHFLVYAASTGYSLDAVCRRHFMCADIYLIRVRDLVEAKAGFHEELGLLTSTLPTTGISTC